MRRPVVVAVLVAISAVALLVPATAFAQTYEVRITNLTRGQIMSPPVIAAHSQATRMFLPGSRASDDIAAVAEDADNSGLVATLGADPEVGGMVVGTGPILPGKTATYTIDSGGAGKLSAVSMLVITNDAFFGLDSFDLASVVARTVVWLPAYDSGSEDNNEDCDFIPGPPCGSGGVRDTKGSEKFIHIHSGILGEGDLGQGMYDWRNPVARMVIIPR